MAITTENLHEAADVLASFGDDETRLDEFGLTFAALAEFVEDSDWRDVGPEGPLREMDPLALAMGISIGVVAAHRKRHEQSLTLTTD